MIRKGDIHVQWVNYPLKFQTSGAEFGQAIVRYEVMQYTDIRNLLVKKSYIVKCTHRLIIPNNKTGYEPIPQDVNEFLEYPALLKSSISILKQGSNIAQPLLLEYAPKTLNTSVNTNSSQGTSASTQNSRQHSTGSTVSQTNSYGGSLSVGFMGDVLTGGASANYEHSTTNSKSKSNSTSHGSTSGSQDSSTAGMSIKDWASYASVNINTATPSWIWGQEFPWNIIQIKNLGEGGQNIVLPKFVENRLYDGTQVYPPSELSLFGIDFVTEATWLISIDKESPDPDLVNLSHSLTYTTATHGVVMKKEAASVFSASLNTDPANPIKYISTDINLGLLALDAIGHLDPNDGAVAGFVPDKFDFPPQKGTKFKLISEENELYITGEGFIKHMQTDFSDAASMTVNFKITNTNRDYTLFMKHWKLQEQGVKISIVVNGNIIVRHVDAREGEGGNKNVTTISLRLKDYSSIDYCDHLQLGLNTMNITFAPTGDGTGLCGYQIKALAII